MTDFGLVMVGSGIKINKWTKESEKFLNMHQKELMKKKGALFVCCGSTEPLDDKENKVVSIEKKGILKKKSQNITYNLLRWVCLVESTISTKCHVFQKNYVRRLSRS